jgi:hypothetical protein
MKDPITIKAEYIRYPTVSPNGYARINKSIKDINARIRAESQLGKPKNCDFVSWFINNQFIVTYPYLSTVN